MMYAGRVVEEGPVGALMAGPLHPYAKGLLGATVHAGLRGRRLTTIPGAPPSLEHLPAGCAFAPRCDNAQDDCLTEVSGSTVELLPDGPRRELRCRHPIEYPPAGSGATASGAAR